MNSTTDGNMDVSLSRIEVMAQGDGEDPEKCFAEYFFDCDDPEDPFAFRMICHENGDAPEICACGTSTTCP